MASPTPFTIARSAENLHPPVASNGSVRMMCLDPDGSLKLRRGITAQVGAPIAERVLPLLNELAGHLLANSDMPASEVASRLHALQGLCLPPTTVTHEWAVAELGDVRVFANGVDVIVTRSDLQMDVLKDVK